ncbi:MAG: aminotransferase class I/II-fold pyridoxal phosphate-dependent enzyme [Filifactor alocis]|nr:aminotransferase class I/II-fold pyridoxal phosphate-dependent enzyme [Filifactor alocis]
MRRESLIEKLKEYNETYIPMHMPGHKRNTELSPGSSYLKDLSAHLDITEVEGFDDLHSPEGILLESMREAAEFWGSETSRYLVNGSTCGILSAIYALTDPGDKILLARNCHKSVYHAVEIRGLRPVFILPEEDEETGILLDIRSDEVERRLREHGDIRLVVITSPTYEGVISDIREICMKAHGQGVPVLVDEAHGAHLGHFGIFPKSAVGLGADVVIQSMHKTLPSLTQTAILHINGKLVDHEEICRAISMFETSSPSYLLIASMDSCMRLLKEEGRTLLEGWKVDLESFRREMEELRHLKLFDHRREDFFDYDVSKIVIYTGAAFMTGKELAELLRREYRIETEMSSTDYCIAMTGLGDKAENLKHLSRALREIDRELERFSTEGRRTIKTKYLLPKQCVDIGRALSSLDEIVEHSEAEGRICSEYIWAYPPGIPLLAPGELITGEILALFASYADQGIELRWGKKHSNKQVCVLLP